MLENLCAVLVADPDDSHLIIMADLNHGHPAQLPCLAGVGRIRGFTRE
jgi:hypothetical protein